MLKSGPQMRVSFGRPWGPATKALIITNVCAFLVQTVLDRTFQDALGRGIVTAVFGLSRYGMARFAIWQPVSYLFLHAGLLHLAFNMLGLYFFGGELEQSLGTRRFLKLYVMTGILAGIGWLLFSWSNPMIPCIGASGAVCGLAAAFAAIFPFRRITLLLFFVLPVTMTARVMAIGYAVLTIYGMYSSDSNIAHVAHLAGGVAGYVWGLRIVRRSAPIRGPGRIRRERDPIESHRRTFSYVPEPEEEYDEDDPLPTFDEVNTILEKIQARGINALTRRERRVLERAASGAKDQGRSDDL